MLARLSCTTLATFGITIVRWHDRIRAFSELTKGVCLMSAVNQHEREAARGDQSLQLLTAVEHGKPFEHAETFYFLFTIGIIGKTTPIA
jgi:hypothetical protein